MPLLKKQYFFLSEQLGYYLLVIGLFAFAFCSPHEKKQVHGQVFKPGLARNDKQDSFPPPKVTFITASNQPEIVKAGKPTVVADTAGMGAPFFTNYTIENGLPINFIINCMQDIDGNLWIATDGGGLVKYDGKGFTTYTTAQGLSDNFIEYIIQDKAGNIWIGTLSNGVCKYDGKTFTNYTTKQGLASNIILRSTVDKDGNIWFGG